MSFGIWFVWTLGYFVSWRTTAFLCIIPNIIVILCLIPLPESPYWLVEAGKIDLAEYVCRSEFLNFEKSTILRRHTVCLKRKKNFDWVS